MTWKVQAAPATMGKLIGTAYVPELHPAPEIEMLAPFTVLVKLAVTTCAELSEGVRMPAQAESDAPAGAVQ
jgi:hypothetical protein